MGLTKQYLAYKSIGNFNVIVSGRPNINFLIYNNIEGRYVVVGAAENAVIWDLRLGQKVLELKRDNQEVTALRPSPDRIHIAVGYIDGVVEIFNIETQTSECTLSLHKTAVTVLRFDSIGMRLISGSLDTELVESDIITQSGKCRLIGHNAAITDAYYLDKFELNNVIVSSSKDMQIKFWNLETQSCFKTIVDNRTEVWNLGLIDNFLIAGCGENAMNVYRLIKKNDLTDDNKIDDSNLIEGLSLEDNDTLSPIKVQNCGVIQRCGKGRVINIAVDNTERVLICHGTNDIIECFYFYTKEEAQIRLKKRLKKLEKNDNLNEQQQHNAKEISLIDLIKRLPNLKIGSKIKSLDVLIGLNDELRIVVSCSNNSLYLYSLMMKAKKSEPRLLKSITQCGHQSEVRSVEFSSDSMIIASGSGESLKIWNRNSMQCIKTIPTDYILSICFVPGDRYILLGMKTGHLLIADISTGEIIEEIPAHQSEIWSICLLPNLKGCCTGSSDTTVKFWDFEILNNQPKDNDDNDQIESSSVLSLLHKNTLKLEESVLCVKISPNSKFIAVGLLDSTVKIFFLDSFKFYLSLYGHKLPVLCMDISYDSNLIITGSADRNVKIWGMDFGDCHRSLFAHDDTVMSIQFISKTHMFFTCGKDGKIKQWDGDNFEKIITLSGHLGEAYNLSVSPNGKYLITCGSDRTLRLFERTDEPMVLQDIQEEEREKYENQILATGNDNINPMVPGLKLPSRKTVGSEAAAESILECLEICDNQNKDDENDKQQILLNELHPLMLAYGVQNYDDFLIAVFQRIRISDLEEALMLLPFTSVCKILERIPKLSEIRKDQTELICKITLFLFKIHHKPIVSNHTLIPIIGKIIKNLQHLITDLRDMIGFNYQALQLLQRKIKETEGIELFTDSIKAKKKRDERNKKRQLTKRLHIQMS